MTRDAAVSALVRATIFVRDLQRSRRFYRALGLTETYFAGYLDHPSASSVLGLVTHHPYPVEILKRPGPNFGMLGLFQLAPEQLAQALPMTTGPARIGEVALVFYVAALDAAMHSLEVAGAQWVAEPQRFELGPIAQREACLRDCDGTLLNLVERPPAEQEKAGPEMDFQPWPVSGG